MATPLSFALVGASGQVGSHLLREALARGHSVLALTRHPHSRPSHTNLRTHAVDVTQPGALATTLRGISTVILSLPFRTAPAEVTLQEIKAAGVTRLLVVGGAGSLLAPDGTRVVDSPHFPVEYREEALAGCRFLEALRAEHELAWTFLSPSAFLHDGPGTGKFRLGDDVLIVDVSGESHISLSDYAKAMIDELEAPRHVRKRFTIGY